MYAIVSAEPILQMTFMEYQHSRLANGLQVISSYYPDMPLTVVTLHTKAGSRYEQPNEFGYAHFAEHITFDGTTRFPSREVMGIEIDRLGAYANAFTSKEVVRWYVQAGSGLAEDMFVLLSDMVRHSLMTAESIVHEQQVIQQEIAHDADDPQRVLYNQSFAALFGPHPLGHSVTGDAAAVASATPEAVRQYYERWVVPTDNALVVVGSLTHKQVIALAQKYFGDWSGKKVPTPPTPVVQSLHPGVHYVPFKTQRTLFSLQYFTIATDERQQSVWELIAMFLAQGRSSLLVKKLRAELGLVYGLGGNHNVFLETGLLGIRSSSTKPREAIAALRSTMVKAAEEFTPEAFEYTRERAKNAAWQVYSSQLQEADFLGGEALRTDKLTTPTDWQKALAAVTYEEVRTTMEQFLTPEKGYLTIVGPEPVELITNE